MGNGGNGGLNTLEYVQKLEHGGIPREQAEAQASALYEVIDSNLASKQDLEVSTLALKHDIKVLDVKIETIRAELKRDIKELDTKLSREIKSMGNAVIVKLAGIMAALLAIFRFLPDILNKTP